VRRQLCFEKCGSGTYPRRQGSRDELFMMFQRHRSKSGISALQINNMDERNG